MRLVKRRWTLKMEKQKAGRQAKDCYDWPTRHGRIKRFGKGNRHDHFINEWRTNEWLCACNLCVCGSLRKIIRQRRVAEGNHIDALTLKSSRRHVIILCWQVHRKGRLTFIESVRRRQNLKIATIFKLTVPWLNVFWGKERQWNILRSVGTLHSEFFLGEG